MNQGGGRGEADGKPLLTGREAETERDMGFAAAAVAERNDVFTTLDILASGQFQGEHLIERRECLEVEAVEAFGGGEPGLPDPPLDHAALAVDQFQLGQAQQIAHMVDALGGAPRANARRSYDGRPLAAGRASLSYSRWKVGSSRDFR